MKVAVIGAGSSGLACALELERLGIEPVIFEKSPSLGDRPGYLIAALRMFHRCLSTPMAFFEKKYGIELTPIHPVKKMIMHSPKRMMVTHGRHGFVFIKGPEENSLEHQLSRHLKADIRFGTEIDIRDIKDDFEHIIVATGDNSIAKDMNNWTTVYMAKLRAATVTGNFERDTLTVWLNKNYSNDGYAYLLAKTENEAELVLVVSQITIDKLDFYWNEFITTENLRYHVTKYHDFEHVTGYPSANHYENLYFTGNAGGMIDSFLGFGALRAIESGIMAARAIALGLDYDKLISPYRKRVDTLFAYRNMMNVMNNRMFDIDLPLLGLPILKHAMYNNPLYKANYGVLVPRIVTMIKRKSYPFRLHPR